MEKQTQKRPGFKAEMPTMEEETGVPTNAKDAAANSFMPEIKVLTTELPSGGKAYPKDSWITHRPYMFGEVMQASGSKLDSDSTYKQILSGVTCSFNKQLLTVPDVLYIGLLRKISTLGTSEIIARYQCKKCKSPGQFIFKTTDLSFADLKVPKLPIVADMSFGTIEFMPMTIADYLKIASMKKGEDSIALYAIQAKNLEFDDAYKKFFNASPGDAAILTEIDSLLYHSLEPFDKKCGNIVNPGENETICGNTIRVELDGGQALLLPFRRDEGPVKTKIRFGLENER